MDTIRVIELHTMEVQWEILFKARAMHAMRVIKLHTMEEQWEIFKAHAMTMMLVERLHTSAEQWEISKTPALVIKHAKALVIVEELQEIFKTHVPQIRLVIKWGQRQEVPSEVSLHRVKPLMHAKTLERGWQIPLVPRI